MTTPDTTEGDAPARFPALRRILVKRRGISNVEKASAALLLAGTVAALIWANIGDGSAYETFWRSVIRLEAPGFQVEFDLRQIVNDILMTFFFFVVGLEVKKEFALGELSVRSRAALPVLAAVAGLVVPAVIFAAIMAGSADAGAWGVVVSSDTAFVLGALAIVGPRLPGHLRVFILALAVVDDIGALAIIALFYTRQVAWLPLGLAVLGLAALAAVRFLRLGRGPLYLVLSVVIWSLVYASGIQPILAGVAIALVIPVFTPVRAQVESTAALTRAFRQSPNPEYARAVARGLRDALSVNERLTYAYSPYVDFLILPLFALANAGVRLTPQSIGAAFAAPLTWAVIAGLVVGKFVGISGMTALARRLRIGDLAPGLTLGRVMGGAALSGIGFTIALFIIDLGLPPGAAQSDARVGVLTASVLAFLAGWAGFRILDRLQPPSRVMFTLVRPISIGRDHIRGPVDAPLSIVEYGDFECPFCSRATGSVDEVIDYFGPKVRYVWRHLPLERYHPHALDAARACEAAGAQGKFFEYGLVLFARQDQLEVMDLFRYADELGLDMAAFEQAFRSAAVANRVRDDMIDAETMDVHKTPTFFINGRRHVGRWDSATLIRELERTDLPLPRTERGRPLRDGPR